MKIDKQRAAKRCVLLSKKGRGYSNTVSYIDNLLRSCAERSLQARMSQTV